MTYELTTLDTPLGVARALVRDGKLNAFQLARWTPRTSSPFARLHTLDVRNALDPAGVASALTAYFRGELDALAAIDVDPDGTPFQHRVWAALRTIPAGETWSYGQLARTLDMPSASRAVGAANGANPCWIVVPCHRVIGASGKLTGYAGGLDVKRWLLDHERAHAGTPTLFDSPSNSRGCISVKSPISARSAAGCAGVSV
jgi:methylated-DNA-[protein]-cysteine S-methyltransferase